MHETCGICESLARVGSRCHVCGSYHLHIETRDYFINVKGVQVVRGFTKAPNRIPFYPPSAKGIVKMLSNVK